MSRYIDGDAVIKAFDKEYKDTKKLIKGGETHLDTLGEGFLECSLIIKKALIVDAIEIVRCKDCKHWNEVLSSGRGACNANMLSFPDAICFCNGGERKEK